MRFTVELNVPLDHPALQGVNLPDRRDYVIQTALRDIALIINRAGLRGAGTMVITSTVGHPIGTFNWTEEG